MKDEEMKEERDGESKKRTLNREESGREKEREDVYERERVLPDARLSSVYTLLRLEILKPT